MPMQEPKRGDNPPHVQALFDAARITPIITAAGNARELLLRLSGRYEITEPLHAEIRKAEQALWDALFPGATK